MYLENTAIEYTLTLYFVYKIIVKSKISYAIAYPSKNGNGCVCNKMHMDWYLGAESNPPHSLACYFKFCDGGCILPKYRGSA